MTKATRKTPWWLWPNLLSLDAPLVAVAWLFMVANSLRNELPWSIYLSLAGVVWIIYVMDRILDTWRADRKDLVDRLERRHLFHFDNRGWFLLAVFVVGMFVLRMVLFELPSQLVTTGLVPLGLAALYFMLAAAVRKARMGTLDLAVYVKNILAGFTFALGTAAGAFAFSPRAEVLGFLGAPEVMGFALLCILNITAIDVWRELRETEDPDQDVLLELSLSLPLIALAVFSLWKLTDSHGGEQMIYAALFVSAAALQMLHRMRARFSGEALRVLADAALILPWPIFFLR